MKFRFPLQKVLDHRKILEDLAQREFQDAQAELRHLQEQRQTFIEELAEARRQVDRLGREAGAGQADRLKQIHDFAVLQALRIRMKEQEIDRQGKLVEARREILRGKAVDHKMMVRLRDRRLEEHRLAENAEEQRRADEMSVLRFDLKDEE